ncbi:hypothetical protein CEXT_637691 [Caerostris extrusa]|uniref:Uncharacterized protein n=1 Tax=Caerostris extrusa TaxID=172846 RepID=A0AAV4MI76_CAEEX|nr:hypothetical protein CEXT_637691 [Caerostris extrusa]
MDLIKYRQCARCVLLSPGHQWTPFLSSPIDAGGAKVISGTLGGKGGHPLSVAFGNSTQDIYCPQEKGNKKISRDKDLIKCRQCPVSHGHQWIPFLSSPIDAGGAKVISGTLGGGVDIPLSVAFRKVRKFSSFSSLSSDKNLDGRLIHVMHRWLIRSDKINIGVV